MSKLFTIILTLYFSSITFAADSSAVPDTTQIPDTISQVPTGPPVITSPPSELINDPELTEPQKYNPYKSMGLSALLPGLGQVYCREYVRGGMYFTAYLLTGLVTMSRINHYRNALTKDINFWKNQIPFYQDSLKKYTPDLKLYNTWYDSLIYVSMGYDLTRYRKTAGQYIYYQAIGWTTGIYLWNIMSTLECSKYFFENKPRKPAVAAWLSAIPYLGLGQVYNGSFTKAGLIFTVHTMLTYMAYNYNRLMNDCITKQNQIQNTLSVSSEILNNFRNVWEVEYDKAYRKRNTYLWYLILFYFYGIFDAVVDAHLHDYKHKIRLKPDITEKGESISFNIQVEF